MAQLKRITRARIEAFLDSLERPEEILPQLIREMEAKVQEAANAEAKALGAVRGSQRRLDEARGAVMRLEEGVRSALRAEDMDTARQAVEALIETEKNVDQRRRELDTAQAAYQTALSVREQLRQNLQDLKIRSKDLLAKQRSIALQQQIQHQARAIHFPDGQSILDAVARMEAKIDQTQAKSEIDSSVNRELPFTRQSQYPSQSERNAQVQRRLDQLKHEIDQTR
ncbi:MAG: PspA/IM30 family protein [Sedimentisphaerales bacterium]|nr:PspA/IM30 family protein [Sedimentisphaerales bacterium]